MNVSVLWMSSKHMDDVMRIEDQCFPYSWNLNDFNLSLKCRNTVGMVALWEREVVGYMVYQMYGKRLHLANFAVAPELWRHGVGRLMVEKLVGKLSPKGRHTISLEIRERNVAAQLFFKAMGFRWVETLTGYYEESEEDCYLMKFELGREVEAVT
jgi:ribosomal-protein-alanine N-acetyltransferase